MQDLVREFVNDEMVLTIAALVVLDLVLGVAAAFKDPQQQFRLSYITDFLRNDVLGKMVPYYAVWVGVRLGGDFELAGIPMIEDGVGAMVLIALGASVLGSLRDLGLWKAAPDELAGHDPASPTVAPTSPPGPPPGT